MARPRPPEELYPFTVRLTAAQIAKVRSSGGGAWVRGLITKAQASRTGRDPAKYRQSIASRDFAIGISLKSTKELAILYRLSPQRINQIRRQHAIDRQIDFYIQDKQRVQRSSEDARPGGTPVGNESVHDV